MIINSIKNFNENLENCVLTFGHFNTIHPGHIRYLKYAKEKGDILAIALKGDFEDKNNKTFKKYEFSQLERAEALELLSISDYIFCLESDELDVIVKKLKPKFLVFGKEFEGTKDEFLNKTIEMQKSNNGKVLFHAGTIEYATTDYLSGSTEELSEKRRKQLLAALKRQNISKSDLLLSIKSFKKSKIIVIGDTIVDQYAACEAIGLSAEAPVVVVRELAKKNYVGGAAIVASHIKALGAQCDIISVLGKDEMGDLVRKKLKEDLISFSMIEDTSRPTTFKKRYVVDNQKLFRVSNLEDHLLTKKIEEEVILKLEEKAKNCNGIVISDFVYGVVTQNIINKVVYLADKYNLQIFADLQCSSQIGSITKFKKFSLLCPNEREARIAMQDKESGLELLSKKLIQEANAQKLLMKLGGDGFIVYDRNKEGNLISQSFPALSVNPVDVAGAGDSLLALMAVGLTSNQSMMKTASLGCFITSLAVENMGNMPISLSSIETAINLFF